METLLPDILARRVQFSGADGGRKAEPGRRLSVLELFHGPTAAFKDFGARFLAATLERIPRPDPRPLTILVATSGDTGGAVAAAFHKRPWVNVVVLYPRGLVSARQEKQLACWGHNVRTLSVAGSFDDCQRMVKEAFVDPQLTRELLLSSANSINVGRLLPQMAYYAQCQSRTVASRRPRTEFHRAVWQPRQRRGLPVGTQGRAAHRRSHARDKCEPDGHRISCARGDWQPRPSVATLASAMDVGNPSNMERLRWLFPEVGQLREQFSAIAVSDDEIRATIRRDYTELRPDLVPAHGHGRPRLPATARRTATERWVLVATAHPAKFNDVVEPLIGAEVPVPPALAELLSLPSIQTNVQPRLDDLRGVLAGRAA